MQVKKIIFKTLASLSVDPNRLPRNSLQMCIELLSHFCFMITLCLINSFASFIASSRLSSPSDPTYIVFPRPPRPVDHVESQKFPLVPCIYGKFTIIWLANTWRSPMTLFPRKFLVLTVSENVRGRLSFLFTAGNKFSSYYNKLRHL